MTLFVTLDPEQQRWARDVATQRIALAKGNPRFAYVTGRSGLDTHTIGCMAELAVATALKLDWPARVGTYREEPDLDPFWEVRWGTTKKVKVATDDKPDQLVMWVTGNPPAFEIHGCILAGWAQEHLPALDPGDRGWTAHWVDLEKLTPFDERFHATCAWYDAPERGWICVYCGAEYQGPLPNVIAGVGGSDAGGRPEGQPEATDDRGARSLPRARRKAACARSSAR